MKRILAFALALILTLSAAGCVAPGEDNTTSKDPSTTNAPTATSEPTGDNATEPSTNPGTTEVPTDPVATEAPTDSVATEAPTTPSSSDEPHTHVYSNWVTTKEASCTETGTRSCSCECGDTKTEVIPKIDHNYVNGVCTGCGKQNYAGTLRTLDNLKVDSVYWCSEDVIVYKKDDCYYMADHKGNVLTSGYNHGINCANPDGYVVAYNSEKESLGWESDGDINLEVMRTTITCHVLDKKGNVVFSTQYSSENHPYITTFSGEYIASCNEGRIITYTSESAGWGEQYVAKTVYMYDMQGTRLETFEKVNSLGTMIGGELVMTASGHDDSPGGILVVDRNGKILRSNSRDVDNYSFLSNGWPMAGFIGGYALLVEDGVYLIISKDLSKVYKITDNYIDTIAQYGSIIATRIDIGGSLSEDYYLVDVTKCASDAYGYITPTLDAAIIKQGYSYIAFSQIFGKDEPYALVSRDGKWGYLSLDGKTEKLYDDAGHFVDGSAIVKDGENFYVIDKDFNQISNAVTGYDSVEGKAGGVFLLKKEDTYTVAVYS